MPDDFTCQGDSHGRTGTKKLGGRIVPDYSQNIFCGTNAFRRPDPPPTPRPPTPVAKTISDSTILGVQKIFSNEQIFSEHQNKPRLPDCEANIARLPLFAQQTGDFFVFLFPTFRPTYVEHLPNFSTF